MRCLLPVHRTATRYPAVSRMRVYGDAPIFRPDGKGVETVEANSPVMKPTFRLHVRPPEEHRAAERLPIRAVGLVEAVEQFLRRRLIRKRERTLRR